MSWSGKEWLFAFLDGALIIFFHRLEPSHLFRLFVVFANISWNSALGGFVSHEYPYFGREASVKRILVVLGFLFALPVTTAFAETRSLDFRNFNEIGVGYGMRV